MMMSFETSREWDLQMGTDETWAQILLPKFPEWNKLKLSKDPSHSINTANKNTIWATK